MKKKYKKGELANMLLGLFLVGGVVVTCATFPGITHIYKLIGARNGYERRRVKQSLDTLHKGGFIHITANNKYLSVTPLGTQKLKMFALKRLYIQRTDKWDKKWRVVMFDILEEKHSRRAVSRVLMDIGMRRLQNSIFVSPFECKKEIKKIQSFLEIKKHLIFMEVVHIDNEQNLKKQFKL